MRKAGVALILLLLPAFNAIGQEEETCTSPGSQSFPCSYSLAGSRVETVPLEFEDCDYFCHCDFEALPGQQCAYEFPTDARVVGSTGNEVSCIEKLPVKFVLRLGAYNCDGATEKDLVDCRNRCNELIPPCHEVPDGPRVGQVQLTEEQMRELGLEKLPEYVCLIPSICVPS